MRAVGKLKLSPWQRFVRLQRTAGQLARELNRPGVGDGVIGELAINRLGFATRRSTAVRGGAW